MPSKTEVKEATEQADLDKASAIRYEVFVVGQDCPPGLEVEFDDEGALAFPRGCYNDGRSTPPAIFAKDQNLSPRASASAQKPKVQPRL